MNCPPIAESLVIAENARLAAQISCALAVPGHYLPVIEGPRLLRPDPVAELVRRNNAVARVRPDRIFLTGLSDEAHAGLMTRFASKLQTRMQRISTLEEIERLGDPGRFRNPPLVWGRDRIGPGLLKALRARSSIVFMGEPSPVEGLPPQSTHLVVCEQGEDLAQVIAANYAYALRAGFCLIPEIDQATSNDLLENFYSLYDERDVSPTEALERLTEQLRDLMGPLAVPAAGSITFITGGLPFGFAVPEVPSTHLFKYPDLGIAMINGLTAEQPDTPGIGFVALVDPQTTDAQEIAAAERLLPPRGAFIRTYYGAGANVRDVTAMMELFPYDLLIIATHCGDVDGHRWTYEFRDSEGLDRTMVVDIGLGMGRTDDADMLHVTQFMRFVSLGSSPGHRLVESPRPGVLAGEVVLIAPLIDAAGIDRRYYEESPILCSCSAQE